jgi:hypothetical protein
VMFLDALTRGEMFGVVFHHARALGATNNKAWRAARRALRRADRTDPSIRSKP